ncbi:MAG: SMP-30/gluconolactonase/LRE family protein [Candidatus Marinimicrobia bacterium]|nr:SMP-30/gluconolactonase/LRE family protein [Candidatus Neomarinimicrobiota bacterium]
MTRFHLIIVGLFSMIFISCSPKSVIPQGKWERVCTGFNFPEGPAWDGKAALYVSNCKGNWMAKVNVRSGNVEKYLEQSDLLPDFVRTNGLLHKAGCLYACEFERNAILKIDDGKNITILSRGTPECTLKRPNDITMGPDGFLYVTDPFHYDKSNPDGVVYKIDPVSGETTIVLSDIAFPNGIAFSPDNQWLFVSESAFNRILKFPYKKGKVYDEPRVFITLPGGDPDGIAFDKAGNLYIAHFGGSAVYMVSPKGNILSKIEAPGKKPSNLEFGGKNLKTLFLTEVETNSVYKIETKISGLSL